MALGQGRRGRQAFQTQETSLVLPEEDQCEFATAPVWLAQRPAPRARKCVGGPREQLIVRFARPPQPLPPARKCTYSQRQRHAPAQASRRAWSGCTLRSLLASIALRRSPLDSAFTDASLPALLAAPLEELLEQALLLDGIVWRGARRLGPRLRRVDRAWRRPRPSCRGAPAAAESAASRARCRPGSRPSSPRDSPDPSAASRTARKGSPPVAPAACSDRSPWASRRRQAPPAPRSSQSADPAGMRSG